MSDLLFVVLACLSLSYSSGNDKCSTGDCHSQRDCVSCTNTKSWSGENCRWCPRDQACHAQASLANECSRAENIINPNDCDTIVHAEYDKHLAYKMIFLSALAYSDDVAKYIPKATEVDKFHLVSQIKQPCSGDAVCSGFVAVSHSQKAIAIAFRGTEHLKQLVTEVLHVLTQPKSLFSAGGKVQGYFLDAFQTIWKDLKNHAYKSMKSYPNYKIWVTGHSLGGALASLASTAIMSEGKASKHNLMLYTFGQPRVGNYDYALAHDKLVPQSFRVTHYRDVVVHLPTCTKYDVHQPCISVGGGPYHHGKEIYYDNAVMIKDSPHKICKGLPHNEDLNCSNDSVKKCATSPGKCIDDHKKYFGISVGTWWKD